jgi:hemerythrin-like domain-containing protein
MQVEPRNGRSSKLETRRALTQILREHEDLRGRLDEIDSLLARIEAGAPETIVLLRDRGLALYEHLRDHIDWEEHILAPILRAQGEDGARRAAVLEREHEEQRELLGFLGGRLAQRRPTELVVRELRSLLDCLREDMAREDAMLRAGRGG